MRLNFYMHISFNNLRFGSIESLNRFKDHLVHSATPLNKKIIMLVSAIFTLLGICYILRNRQIKKKKLIAKSQSDNRAMKAIEAFADAAKISEAAQINERLKKEALQKNIDTLQTNFDAMQADLHAREKAKLGTEDELAQKKEAIQKLQDQIALLEKEKLTFKSKEAQWQKDLNQKDKALKDAEQKKKDEVANLEQEKDKALKDAEQKKQKEIADLQKQKDKELEEAEQKKKSMEKFLLDALTQTTKPQDIVKLIKSNPTTLSDAYELHEDYTCKLLLNISLEAKLKKAKNAGIFLQPLNLSKTEITNEQLIEVLAACPHLKELNLSECHELQEKVLQYLPSDLRTLKLSNCSWLTDSDITVMPNNLRSLDLCACNNLTKNVIKVLPTSLEELDLQFFHKLNKDNIRQLPPNLKSLNLSDTNFIDDYIEFLPKKIESLSLSLMKLKGDHFSLLPPNLHTLDLSHCLDILDSDIKNLPKNLLNLNLSWCLKISIISLGKLPPKLQSLDLSHCNSIAVGEFIDNALQSLADLKIITLDQSYQKKYPEKVDNLSKKFEVIINPN